MIEGENPITHQTRTDAPSEKVQSIELGVFLFLILPSMVLPAFALQVDTLSFPLVAAATIFQDLALLSLVFYFAWRNGEPPPKLGCSLEDARKETFLGVGLFFPLIAGITLLERLMRQAGASLPQTPPPFMLPSGAAEILLAVVLLIVVAVAEEIIFRGYLILRLKTVTKSSSMAVVLSAAVFSIGHGYQGTSGLLAVGLLGVFFALIYLWRGSLLAPMVMHFLQNFVGLILVPLGMAG